MARPFQSESVDPVVQFERLKVDLFETGHFRRILVAFGLQRQGTVVIVAEDLFLIFKIIKFI